MANVVSATGRLALAAAFATAPRAFAAMHVNGLENDPRAPRTIYAITHKRDLDAMAPLPFLLAHRGWHGLTADVKFPMRGDGFQPGFLARVIRRPDWFARLVRPLSLGPILDGIGILPLDALHFRPAEMWIQEEVRQGAGGVPAREALAPGFIGAVAAATGSSAQDIGALPLSHLLSWRYFRALMDSVGPEILIGEAQHRAERRAVEAAKRQLDACAAWLRAGGSLYTSPEGYLSPDGRINALRAGLHRILRASPPDTLVVPVAIVYDFMRPGRLRVWVDVAPPLAGAARMGRRELGAALRAAWLRAARFTCTQLASGVVMEAREGGSGTSFTTAELAGEVAGRARSLATAGRNVDPALLSSRGAARAVRRYVRYARRHGDLESAGADRWRVPAALAPLQGKPNEPGYRSSPLRYAWNELRDTMELDGLALATRGQIQTTFPPAVGE